MLNELITDMTKRRGAVAAERVRVGIELLRTGTKKIK